MKVLKSFLALLLISCYSAEAGWYNSTDGRQYFIQVEPKVNWYAAVRQCSDRDLQLVEIDSPEKNEALVDVLKSVFNGKPQALWLGANDEYNPNIDRNRPFHWTSSGKPMAFSYWHHNEPNNCLAKEHCVSTYEGSQDFRWNDRECDNFRYGFICEDRQSYRDFRSAMQDRRRRVLEALQKFNLDYQEEETNAVEKLHLARELVMIKNYGTQQYFEDIRKKMSHDFNQNLAILSLEANNFATDINRMIHELKDEVQEATQKSNDNLNQRYNEVQQVIENILLDTDL